MTSKFSNARAGGAEKIEKMAARERQARERSRSAQPTSQDSDTEDDGDRARSTASSKLFATMLVLPGIFLYVYILYIVLANLLYPCSLAPFLSRNSSSTKDTDSDAHNTGLGEKLAT